MGVTLLHPGTTMSIFYRFKDYIFGQNSNEVTITVSWLGNRFHVVLEADEFDVYTIGDLLEECAERMESKASRCRLIWRQSP